MEGLGRKSEAPLSHDDSDEGSDNDDDSDDESVDSLYHDVAEEQPPRQIRPLIVSEINANYEIASSDCNHGADPIEFTDRRIPADVALNVSVTVKHGVPKRELPTCATINEVSRLFSFTEDQHRAFAIAGRALLQCFSTEDDYFSMPDEELASSHAAACVDSWNGWNWKVAHLSWAPRVGSQLVETRRNWWVLHHRRGGDKYFWGDYCSAGLSIQAMGHD